MTRLFIFYFLNGFLVSQSVLAAPAYKQKAEVAKTQSGRTIVSPAFSTSVGKGGFVICSISYANTSVSVSSVVDSKGGQFLRVGTPLKGGGLSGRSLEVWYKENTAGGAGYSVTANFSSTFNANKQISCQEYSGIQKGSSIDQQVQGSGTSGTAQLAAVTPSAASELVFVSAAVKGTSATISGYNRRSSLGGRVVADKIIASANSQRPSINNTGGGWQLMVVTFKSAVQPPPPATPLFTSFPPGFMTINAGSGKSLGGVRLRLTLTGDLQVVSTGGTVLWHSNSSAPNCTPSNCLATFQTDGNLVIYVGGNPIWSTGTFNQSGASLILQPKQSYLTIRDSNYGVIWTSGGAAALGMLLSSRKGPQAATVQSFHDTLGINSHMNQYEHDPGLVLQKLQYLGIRHLRENYGSNQLPDFKVLANGGIRLNILAFSDNFSDMINQAKSLNALAPNALASLEGPNEINNFPFTCQGSVWQGGCQIPMGPPQSVL